MTSTAAWSKRGLTDAARAAALDATFPTLAEAMAAGERALARVERRRESAG